MERGRKLAVTIFREEDTPAVRCSAPEHRRIDRTGLRERTSPRLPYESRKSVIIRPKANFYLLEVLRIEELPV